MVVRPPRYDSKNFDWFVKVLISRWEEALERQAEWASLDEEERDLYSLDWPVNNDIHQHLADYVAEHELTEEQKAQWDKLSRLVVEHTKDLEEMGYGVVLPQEPKKREREVA